MYLAMNRFKVKKDRSQDFEAMWLGRDSHLASVEGFVEFRLLRGPEREEYILYSSHTFWKDEQAFAGWIQSDAFRRAHAGTGKPEGEPMTYGKPNFEGFTSVQTINKDGETA